MNSQAKFKCAICNTSMSTYRVLDDHKTLCVACELKETTLDILAQATTPPRLHPNPLWLTNTWAPYAKQEDTL